MKISLSTNICKLRKEHSMTQEQLAEALGVTFASVSKWERGVAKPELELIAEIADLFEVSIDALVAHNLNADRMEALIVEMEKAVDDREEEKASTLCEKILRNYPNNNRAVDACTSACYKLYIHTSNKVYMTKCIAQTKRLMTLNQGEPERDRLARIHFLANQYELLGEWDTAKEYYEQSNVDGSSDQDIARCLLAQSQHQEAIDKLSYVLVESIFRQYQAITSLVDGWIAMDEKEKACEALEWIYGVMDSLKYNPTTMMITQLQLAGLYEECGKHGLMESAIRKAAELVKENTRQEFDATANFLRINKAREMIISAPHNRELLLNVATSMGPDAVEIVNEILS
jgi:transcriptional regulator with XRE-family HTH domain